MDDSGEEFYDQILNRDKYKDGNAQKEAYHQYCADNKVKESVEGFVKWLDEPWKSASAPNSSDIAEGDFVFVRNSPVIRVVKNLKFSKKGELWVQVTAPDSIGRYNEILPITQVSKAERKAWSKEECVEMLGKVIEDPKDGIVEQIMRVKTGKDGKVYVNGIRVDELASSWRLYDTKEPCCRLVRASDAD